MATELSQSILWHGDDSVPSTPRWLTAGPVTAGLEDGQLRGIYLNGREVVRRIYGAVRDRFWNTVPGVLTGLSVEERAGGFRVSFVSTHISDEVDFVWRGEITGDADGTVEYVFSGEARREMHKNRVGLCLLLPLSMKEQTAEVEYVSGDRAAVKFPALVDPMQPVRGLHDFRRLTFSVGDGVELTAGFEGDVFEIEDQRNWTDASFKAYSTPQRIPMPARMAAGQQVTQAVRLQFRGTAGGAAVVPVTADTVEIKLGGPAGLLPEIGVGAAFHGQALTERELSRLRALHLSHYRLEVDFSSDGAVQAFERGLGEAAAMGAQAEVVLLLSGDGEAETRAAAETASRYPGRVVRWLALSRGKPASQALSLAEARRAFASCGGSVGGGTDADFFQLNNNRPEAALMDFVSVPLRPCAHQFDRATLTENLAGQREVLASLAAMYPGLPLAVSPVSFRTRAQKGPAAAPGELPAQADVRQMSLLGAAWTVGCIKAVAESGASSVTLFQTTGLRGIMERESGSAAPREFHSVPGGVFPVYFVIAALAGWKDASITAAESGAPCAVEALAVQKGSRMRVILANYSAQPQRVTLSRDGTAAFRTAGAFILDASNAAAAMTSPESLLAAPPLTACAGGVIELPPFAVAWVDLAQG